MVRDGMLAVVKIHVLMHPLPLLPEALVVLRTGQRGKAEEFEYVERQLPLYDGDVLADRFRRVKGKTENIASRGDRPCVFPGEQHRAVFRKLVLALLRREQVRRIDAFEADQHAVRTRTGGLLDEIWDLVAQRVDLDHQPDVHALAFAQRDNPVEDRLPLLVAGDIVVVNEEVPDALVVMLAYRPLHVVR